MSRVRVVRQGWRGPVVMASLLLTATVIMVTPAAAGAAVVTFSSNQVGTSGTTPSFNETGAWVVEWSYTCTAASPSGGFSITVNQPSGDAAHDNGPFALGASGSGTDYYYDAGPFSLTVNSGCDWSIAVTPTAAPPLAAPATFTSASIGTIGDSRAFTVGGPWTMAWSYSCAPGVLAHFSVDVDQPTGDSAVDLGPNDSGDGDSGTDAYTDSGVFSLDVASTCTWSITIASTSSEPHGYWLVGSDGGIFSFGSAQFHGSTGGMRLARPVVGIAPTPDRGGYWLVAADGGVFNYGDATFFGSIPALGIAPAGSASPSRLSAPIVAMVPSSDDGGYFMVGADGGVFAFGDAKFSGSCPGIGGCSGAAVAVMPDATGEGYWLVTVSGHVYAFGDAVHYGAPSLQTIPVTSAAATPDGLGYWILYANGSVAAFGDATNLGQPTNVGGLDPATAIFPTAGAGGYWVATAIGAVYSYGDAPADGSMAGQHLDGSIVGASGS
jgi:hypothetical protein